jgi:hypothetical protein
MANRQSHPARDLFDYVKGDTNDQVSRTIEAHLADCNDCSTIAQVVGAIRKSEISDLKSQTSEPHPEVSELASFFYGGSTRAKKAATAAHVAVCRSCADQIAEYARAEHAACTLEASKSAEAGILDAAWEMIRNWEESSFAATKTESRQSDQDMIARLTGILSKKKDDLRKQAREADVFTEKEDCVSVIIVDQTARFLGVEIFEKIKNTEGGSLFKHVEKSDRFDNKPFHALLDFGEESVVVVTDTIRRDCVRLQKVTRPNTKLQRADYFIIEGADTENDD